MHLRLRNESRGYGQILSRLVLSTFSEDPTTLVDHDMAGFLHSYTCPMTRFQNVISKPQNNASLFFL